LKKNRTEKNTFLPNFVYYLLAVSISTREVKNTRTTEHEKIAKIKFVYEEVSIGNSEFRIKVLCCDLVTQYDSPHLNIIS
jgi:hypothetical protein